MLRRTLRAQFRYTAKRLSGGELYHPPKLEEIPRSSSTKGFVGPYNGVLKVMRVLDIKWMMNRSVELGREYYIAAPTFYFFLWWFCYKGFCTLMYSDGAPPREVPWNTGESGFLPPSFVPTPVTNRV